MNQQIQNLFNASLRFFVLLLVWSYGFSAFAQSDRSGIGISPNTQKIEVEASASEVPVQVSIANLNNKAVEIKLSTVDFGQLNETGGIFFVGRENTELNRDYALSSWLEVPDKISLLPGEIKNISARIINRSSLTPGGHYGAILGTVTSSSIGGEKDNNAVAVQNAVSSLLFVTKKGGENYGLNLKNISFVSSLWKLPGTISLLFENMGNVHLVPRGLVEIRTFRGDLVAKGIINQDSQEILPDRVRTMSSPIKQFKKILWPGIYQVRALYRYDGKQDFAERGENILYFGSVFSILLVGCGGWLLFKLVVLLRRKLLKTKT